MTTSIRLRIAALGLCFALTPIFIGAQVTGARPLVTVLTTLPAPVQPDPSKQWNINNQVANQSIPDNRTMGIDAPDIDGTDIFGGSCQQIYGIQASFTISHPRPADLIVTLRLVSRDGVTILGSKVLFNGPDAARGLKPADAAKIAFPPQPIDTTSLITPLNISSQDCSRFRLNVSDMAPGNTGTLVDWTLRRRIAVFPYAHNPDYYQGLIFGTPVFPFRQNMTPNVADYFREISRGKFTFWNAGIIGPVSWEWLLLTDDQQVESIIHLMESRGFDFRQFDVNHDNIVENGELEIVVFDNVNQVSGKNRNKGDCTTVNSGGPLRICVSIAFVTEQVNFETLTHEISHSLGTVDLYAESCYSQGLTLMDCTLGSANNPLIDDKATLYLDPWHRKMLGWLSPISGSTGTIELGDESWVGFHGEKLRPAWIRNPNDGNEYFLFEYRGRRSYDADVNDIGLVAWHVKEDGHGNAYKGPDGQETEGHAIYAVSPDNSKGGSHAWHPEDGRFQLQWSDGTLMPHTLWVEQPRNSVSSVILHIADAPANNRVPTIDILKPPDNSSGPYGFGAINIFQARVVDARGGTDGLRISWSSDIDGNLGTGATTAAGFMTPGKRKVTVTARDKFGATASKTISFEALKVPPSPTIYSPGNNQNLFRNQTIHLLGYAPTPIAFTLDCGSLVWTLNRLPGWMMTGCDIFQSFNLLGPARFTLTATDEFGTSASTTVQVQFVDPPLNSPPLVTITAPLPGEISGRIQVSGVATDPAGGAVKYRWTAFNLADGSEIELSRKASFDWVPASVFPNGTSIEVRLYGTNSRGDTTRVSVLCHVLFLH